MKEGITRTFRQIAAALLFAMIAGCAAIKVGYNNAQVAARWFVDDYVSFAPEQDSEFRARFASFHGWHRQHELPHYAALARATAERVSRGLTAADVQWGFTAVRARYRSMMAQAIDTAAPLLAELTPAQIAEIEKGFIKANQKFVKERSMHDASKRAAERAKRMRKVFDDWLGELTDAQEARIDQAARVIPDIYDYQLAERKRNQRELLALLRANTPAKELAARLKSLIVDAAAHRDPEYALRVKEAEAGYTALALDLDRTLTAAQRAHAVKRINRYAEDFSTLASSGAAEPAKAQASAGAG